MASARLPGRMPTPTLRAFPPPLRYEVHPLAVLHEGGVLEACGPWLPAEGPGILVVWRPGEDPGFAATWGALERRGARWRLRGEPARPGWAVLWVPAPGAAGKGS